jgi:endonuclease YncB( thermonuclease family)
LNKHTINEDTEQDRDQSQIPSFVFEIIPKAFSPAARITAAILLTAASTGVWADGGQFAGRVVGVTDGDTVTVLDTMNRQHEIRLAYIDAPETTCHARKPSASDDNCVDRGQPFAKAAKKALSKMIYQQDVVVDVIPGSSYGREIGSIFTRDAYNAYLRSRSSASEEMNPLDSVNFIQVESGMAWFYRHYASHQLNVETFTVFSAAEKAAVGKSSGLWSQKNPEAPWDYRHEHSRQNVAMDSDSVASSDNRRSGQHYGMRY